MLTTYCHNPKPDNMSPKEIILFGYQISEILNWSEKVAGQVGDDARTSSFRWNLQTTEVRCPLRLHIWPNEGDIEGSRDGH